MNLAEKYTVDYVESNNLVLLKVLVGSYSQNLQTPKSDKDYAGIFILDAEDYYSLDYKLSDFDTIISTGDIDITYMEIGKFISLLNKNIPNALEILASASIQDNIIIKSGLIDLLDISKILSKKCQYTFGKYASDQVKKATGLNKKMNNPVPIKKKTPIDFCTVMTDDESMSLTKYLKKYNLDQQFIGLSGVKNAKSTFRVYYDYHSALCFSKNLEIERNLIADLNEYKKDKKFGKFKGIINPTNELSNTVRISSIPKNYNDDTLYNIEYIGTIYYNLEGYETYCKDYREYREWEEKRNPERHKHNCGQKFDVKNMSHCCRLLKMAEEIATTGKINLKRYDDADFFRDIKLGKINYELVMEYSNYYADNLDKFYKNSDLRNDPDYNHLNKTLTQIRKKFYK